ncbi:MAG: Uma2 family endonuclease, partial [Bacteroidota bacterium]
VAGIFINKPRVELIDGEIYTMSPFTPDHNSHVDKITEFFIIQLYGKAKVRSQGSVKTDENSKPEPDIAVLKFKENFYRDRQATAKDIHLIIEVSVFTTQTDRTTKKKKYAAAGIPEYWIVLPKKSTVEVYRNPSKGNYLEKSVYQKIDEWIFTTFDLKVKGTDLLI